MKLTRCALVGSICGLVGAGIWAAIAHFANAEIGWIAWGIGLLVGIGVLKAADGEYGLHTGFLAAGIAIVAIVAGKYAASHLAVQKVLGDTAVSVATIQDEAMIADVARDEVVPEFTSKKKKLVWPNGMKPEEASEPQDFPKDVWAEADKRWKAKPEAERTKLKTERAEEVNKLMGALGGAIRDQAFQSSFSAMDIIFFGLAIVTAFKFGAGVQGGN